MTEQNKDVQQQTVLDQTPVQPEFVDGWFDVPTENQDAEQSQTDQTQNQPVQDQPIVDADVSQQQTVPDQQQTVRTESQRALEQVNQYQPLVDLYQNDPNFQQHVESYVNRNDPRSIPQQPMQPMNPRGLPQQPNPYDVARQQLGYQQPYPVNPYAPMQYPPQYGDPQMNMQPVQQPMLPSAQNVAQQMNLPKPPEEFEPYQMTDPNTPSGKYFLGVLNQFGQQIGNNFANQLQQQQMAYGQQLEELRLAQIQRDAEESQFNQFLAARPDLDMRTARQFWDWASNPNNVTVDSLYDVFKSTHQQTQQLPQNQQINQQQSPNQNPLDKTLEKIRQNQNFPQTSVNVNQQTTDEDEGTKFLKGLDNHFF
jgi:hypothetical protein